MHYFFNHLFFILRSKQLGSAKHTPVRNEKITALSREGKNNVFLSGILIEFWGNNLGCRYHRHSKIGFVFEESKTLKAGRMCQ